VTGGHGIYNNNKTYKIAHKNIIYSAREIVKITYNIFIILIIIKTILEIVKREMD